MLRDYADSLSSILLRAFPPDKGYPRAAFARDPMPPPVAHFLAQTLQARLDIEVERHRSVRSNWFDYGHEEVQHAQLTFAAVLGQHARIPQEDWPRLVHDAVQTVLSYLVRPVPTLVDFLFDEQEEGTVPASDVLRGLGFFSAYPYLREVTTAYLKQKGLQEVERERLQTVLRHSDREMTRGYDASAWLRLLAPLFTLFETDPAEAGGGVPVEALAAFFEDKEAGLVLVRLRERAGNLAGRVSEAELRALLEDPSPSAPPRTAAPVPLPAASPESEFFPLPEVEPVEEDVEPEEWPESVQEEPVQEEPEPDTSHATPIAVPVALRAPAAEPPAPPAEPVAPPVRPVTPPVPAPPSAVPLWQQFQKPAPPPATPAPPPSRPLRETERPASAPPNVRVQPRPAAPVPPPAASAQAEQGAGSRVPLWMQFRRAKPEEGAGDDLATLEASVLGESSRQKRDLFVKQLFSGSQAEYERVLRRLDGASSWGGASQIIAEEVFRKHRVNIYSEAAVAFTNAVEEQYRQ